MNYVHLKTMQKLCKILFFFIFDFIFQECTSRGRQLILDGHTYSRSNATLMDSSHTGATPRKPQAVQVTCDDTTRTLDRTDNSQLNTLKLCLVDPNDPAISFVTEMQQSTETRDV